MAKSDETTGPKASPLDGFDQDEPRRSRTPKVLMWTGSGLVVLGGLYGAGQWAVADKVARGTTGAGVQSGGKSATGAAAALEAGLADRLTSPIAVEAGGLTAEIDPENAGLALDAAGTVDGLVGFDLAPAHLWYTLVGGDDVTPRVTVDDAALDAELTAAAEALRVEPVDGAVVFADGQVTATPATAGSEVDVDAAREVVVTSWLTAEGPLSLPVVTKEPTVTQEETDAALALGRSLVSAPVRVEVADQKAELPISVLASAASFVPADGNLKLQLDKDAIAEAVLDRTTDLEKKAADAKFVFSKGKPVIKGGDSGLGLDRDALATAVLAAGTANGDRTAKVELVPVDAKESKEKLESLGVKEVVAEFSTPLGVSTAARIHNLELGAKRVTGQLILPGETWSLTETLAPITAENGYRAAGIVNNGQLTEGVGGGLSQMATTTYNVGFLLGIEDVEHRPHSYYFSRYPEGREATIYVGSIDMRFKNDTPYGILLQSFVKDGKVTVRAWSTPYYEVKSTTSGRSGVVYPKTQYSTAPGCIAQGAGSPGFTVTVTRKVYLEGELVKDEPRTWRYNPQNAVVCGKAPSDKKKD